MTKEKLEKTCKNQSVAIVVLNSALRKVYETENQMSVEGYKTIEDAVKLVNEIMAE